MLRRLGTTRWLTLLPFHLFRLNPVLAIGTLHGEPRAVSYLTSKRFLGILLDVCSGHRIHYCLKKNQTVVTLTVLAHEFSRTMPSNETEHKFDARR